MLSRAALVLSVCLAPALAAQDWPNWRGPNYDGSSPAKDLPTEFSRDKNVRWTCALPGSGANTPIVVGDRVFLTSVDTEAERLVVMCVNRKNGSVLWSHEADSGYRPHDRATRTRGNTRSNYASPSPVTDGETVVFFFGNGDLIAYDFTGEEKWRHNIQKKYGDFAFQWTFSATPTMHEGKLWLPVLQRNEEVGRRGSDEPRENIDSFLLAFDPATGKELVNVVRPTDAKKESRESYTTMIPWTDAEGRKQLVLAGGDVLTGHALEDGKELWRWGTWNAGHREVWWRLVPSVCIGDGIGLVCAPKRAPAYAIKMGGNGTLGEDALAWASEGRPNKVSSDVPTPAFDGEAFYVLSDVRSALTKVKPQTGEIVWSTDLSKDFLWRASPTVADGKIYIANHNGQVAVVDKNDGKILSQVQMGRDEDDRIRSSVVVAQGNLFIRTNDALFCIGK